MNPTKTILVLSSLLLAASAHAASSEAVSLPPEVKSGWKIEAEILTRIQEPKFPKHDFAITDFGAVGDGKTDCTEAIAKAIEACAEKGGGRVVVPAGQFLTGAIHLK